MPTVKYKCGDTGKMKTKKFPYNSMGKAQADTYAKLMNGTVKNNPTKKEEIMPTVKYKCGDTGKMKTKKFPYNSMGKAQADTYAKLMNGTVKNNPTKKMTESGY